MLEEIGAWLAPYYQVIRFVHVLAVMVWIWSTSEAYAFYLVPIFKAWRRNPGDIEVVRLRNWAIERFDHGVIYEHIAFPVILITGPLLYIVGGHDMREGWLLLKLLIVVGVFIPIEIADYTLSHFALNKHKVRLRGEPADYERAVHIHWWFLLITSSPVMVGAVVVVFLAIVKPF